jgi:predicted ABC-type ATPase
MPTSVAREFFYIENGKRRDAELHDYILDQGDDAAAKAVSDKVKARLLKPRDVAKGFDPDEPRDESGKWTDGGGGDGGSESGSGSEGEAKPGKTANATHLYTAPSKSADEIVAGFPGGAEAINQTRDMLKGVVATDRLPSEGGFKNADGSYTPQRQVLHNDIVSHFINDAAIKKYTPAAGEQPTLTVLGGRGGSGKSWLTGKDGPIDSEKSMLLDADAIKTMLPGYQGWNAAQFHEESSDIAALIDRRAAALGMNVILDGTLKSSNIAERIKTYKAAGDYALEGYYMYASPQTAATRAMARFSKGGTFKGRFVPPEVILGNTNNEKNFDKLSADMRKWAVYDNDAEGRGSTPKLVSHSG